MLLKTSHMFSMLGEEDLSMLEFPVGQMTKSEVREIAHDLDLRSASKPDGRTFVSLQRTGS